MGSKSIKCKSCEKEVSKSAKTCPHCGEKLKKGFWWKFLLAWVVLAVIVRMSTGEEEKTKPANSPTKSSSETKSISQPTLAKNTIKMPKQQQSLIEVVNTHKDLYDDAPNELKKSSIRMKRAKAIKKALNGKRNFVKWVGTIDGMGTTSEQNAYMEITLAESRIDIQTWNNELSDIASNTLIKAGSALYNCTVTVLT